MVVHLDYFSVNMPGNIEMFIHEISKIVRFDLLKPNILVRFFEETTSVMILSPDQQINMKEDLMIYIIGASILLSIVAIYLILMIAKKTR